MLDAKKVYICSPLSAPTQKEMKVNMILARQHMQVIKRQYGCRTYAPHAYLPELLNDYDPEERALGLSFGMELLKQCQSLVICGDRISEGMYREIKEAVLLGLEIYSCNPKKAYQLTLIRENRRQTDEMPV